MGARDRPGAPAARLRRQFATFHPTFLYECVWNLAAFAVLIWARPPVPARPRPGRSRSTSWSTRSAAAGSRCCGSTTCSWTTSSGCGSTSGPRSCCSSSRRRTSSGRPRVHPGREESSVRRGTRPASRADAGRLRTTPAGDGRPGRRLGRRRLVTHDPDTRSGPAALRDRLIRSLGPMSSPAERPPPALTGLALGGAATTTGEPVPPCTRSRRPRGLYDPRHEHDACGVAFVATLTGVASHDIVAKALTALRNLDHRGAAGAETELRRRRRHPDPGPRRVPPREVVDFELPPPGAYAVGTAFLPGDADAVAKATAAHRGDRRRGGPRRSSAGARCPTDAELARRDRARRACRRSRSCSSPAPGRPADRAWRWSGWPSACASAPSTRPTSTSRRCPSRTLVYKGMLTTDAARPRSSPTCSTSGSRQRAGRRALAVLHQHLPEPGRWPTRSAHRPQRRDQHRAWATATGCGPARRCSTSDLIPGDLERLFPICTPGRLRLGVVRRGARAAAPRRPLAAARGADDDPGGVGEPRRDGRRAPRRSTSSTPR